MEGEEEVNMGRCRVVLNMKESLYSKMKKSKEEHVSNVYSSDTNDNDDTLTMQTVRSNNNIMGDSGWQEEKIKEFVDIARKPNQASEIMNFPPFDHDVAISYVYAFSFIKTMYTHLSHLKPLLNFLNLSSKDDPT